MVQDRAETYRLAGVEIRRFITDCDTHYYELGRVFLRFVDEKLFLEGGYDTMEQYLQDEVDFSKTTAYLIMRVVRNFSAETAARHGMYKLAAVLAFLDATPEADTPADLVRPRGRAARDRAVPVICAGCAQSWIDYQ